MILKCNFSANTEIQTIWSTDVLLMPQKRRKKHTAEFNASSWQLKTKGVVNHNKVHDAYFKNISNESIQQRLR